MRARAGHHVENIYVDCPDWRPWCTENTIYKQAKRMFPNETQITFYFISLHVNLQPLLDIIKISLLHGECNFYVVLVMI